MDLIVVRCIFGASVCYSGAVYSERHSGEQHKN